MALHEYPDLIQGSPRTLARFGKFVPAAGSDQCWEWQSTRNRRGYGKFWLDGRTDLAHRVSYRLFNGAIPARIVVRHTCDNPPCVNPSHLILGTIKDNARDAVERGRYRRGSDNVRAKLTPTQVREIRACKKRGETYLSLATRFGVSRGAIYWVVTGRNWAEVGDAS